MTATEPTPSPVELHPECQEHGCTADDCVCYEYEDEKFDNLLLAAAVGRTTVYPDAYSIEYIEDARMLIVNQGWPRSPRLYLDETTGEIHTVPAHMENAQDMADFLSGRTPPRQVPDGWSTRSPGAPR